MLARSSRGCWSARWRDGRGIVKQTPRTLAILSFHKIGKPSVAEWDTWFYISEDVFAAQLNWLRTNGWHVLSAGGFLRGLLEPDTLPERSALLTFDDGYQSTATEALPCLQRFGFPAVVFVPTAYIGRTNAFDLDSEPEERMCTWEELRRLEAGGVAVESHGVTHRTFSELSPAEQREELEGSKAVLEAGLGKLVQLFAFPYGDGCSPDALRPALCRAGYRAAFLYAEKETYVPETPPVQDGYRIDRIAMGPDTDLAAVLGQAALRGAR
jgi:peptidoglycan/xylan/chitin deacetylase (PgdA/CDA1 family)